MESKKKAKRGVKGRNNNGSGRAPFESCRVNLVLSTEVLGVLRGIAKRDQSSVSAVVRRLVLEVR